MTPLLWVILVFVVLLVFYIISLFNGLIRLRNEVDNSMSQIDVQLKRRFDLIPNLVETVKGYAKHEKTLFENITKARAAVMSASNLKDKASASNKLTATLKSLFAVAENYPDLKANQNFLQLQEELTGTENKISYARQHYNDIVMMFNNRIQTFPNNAVSGMLGFNKRDMFEAPAGEKEPVRVKF